MARRKKRSRSIPTRKYKGGGGLTFNIPTSGEAGDSLFLAASQRWDADIFPEVKTGKQEVEESPTVVKIKSPRAKEPLPSDLPTPSIPVTPSKTPQTLFTPTLTGLLRRESKGSPAHKTPASVTPGRFVFDKILGQEALKNPLAGTPLSGKSRRVSGIGRQSMTPIPKKTVSPKINLSKVSPLATPTSKKNLFTPSPKKLESFLLDVTSLDTATPSTRSRRSTPSQSFLLDVSSVGTPSFGGLLQSPSTSSFGFKTPTSYGSYTRQKKFRGPSGFVGATGLFKKPSLKGRILPRTPNF